MQIVHQQLEFEMNQLKGFLTIPYEKVSITKSTEL